MKKSTSLLDSLLEDLESEDTNASGRNQIIDINADNIQELWNQYVEHIRATAHGTYFPVAERQKPIFSPPNELILREDNTISSGFLDKNKSEMVNFFRDLTGTILTVTIEVVKENQDETPRKVFKSTKERFKEMAEKNPALLELQKLLDLDFDY